MTMAKMLPDGRATVSVGDEAIHAPADFSLSRDSTLTELALQLGSRRFGGAEFANEGQRGAHEECGSE